jgi:hypothetical protein
MPLSKEDKDAVIREYAVHEGDTGSAPVQVGGAAARVTQIFKQERPTAVSGPDWQTWFTALNLLVFASERL